MFRSDINYPKVSVVVPFYNSSETIDETLCSVEAQTYPSVEIIVVNDGSNEYHSNKLKQILSNRPHVQLVEQPNKGLASARNLGARQASGVYFCFLDSDDVIKPQYLAACAEVLKDPKIKLVYTKAEFFGAREGDWSLPPYEGLKSILLGNRIPNAVALQRSKDFFELGGFDESFRTHEDWDYWIRLLQNEGDVVCIQDVLFMYRKRSDGTSLIDQLEREPRRIQEDWQKIYDKHRSLYLQHNLGYYDLIVQLNKMEQSERMLSTHLKDVSEFKDVLASQLNEVNASKRLLEGQLNEANNHKSLLEVQLTEISDSKSLIENQLESANQSSQMLKAQLDEMIQLNGQLDRRYQKYKKLWTVRLMKPIIKTEQAISSANTLRKGFRRLIKEKGSIGKGYQHLRRLKKSQGFRAVKTLLRAPHGGLDAFNSRINYDDWVKRYDTLSVADIEPMKLKLAAQKLQPLISIVMPTYNPKIEWLIEAIESVQAQIYPHWELCIADDCSSDPRVQETLQAMAQKDKRIKVVTREKNGHISAASNSALELAQGEWIALMDHDDLLPIHALYCVAQTIHQHPDAQMIYSDEDKINEQGTRLDPYFKPDWNIDLFYSHNMFSHLGVYRKTLIDHVGGFRLGFEGAQDYDLALRCIEQIDHQHIHHIPRMLYHWRVHAQSTAQSSEAKPYAAIAGQKALNEHFQRTQLNAQCLLLDFGMYRTQYALPERLPLVSLIIPTKNAQKLVMQCVESILEKTTYPNYEIIIVDNASDDAQAIAYFKQLANEHSNIRVIRDDRPFNYSQLNNNAVQYTNGELIGLINNDIEVISPDWLGEMVSIALQKNVGAVGAKLYYPNNTIQHAGVVIGLGGVANHVFKHAYRDSLGYFGRAKLISSYSAVTAACLIIKKSIFTEVGGLDEENLKVAFNDVDFCLKVRSAGYRNVWTSFAELYHHESVSRGADDIPEKRQRFEQEVAHMRKKWQTDKFEDPAYSPNLTLDFEDFSFACPPRVSKI